MVPTGAGGAVLRPPCQPASNLCSQRAEDTTSSSWIDQNCSFFGALHSVSVGLRCFWDPRSVDGGAFLAFACVGRLCVVSDGWQRPGACPNVVKVWAVACPVFSCPGLLPRPVRCYMTILAQGGNLWCGSFVEPRQQKCCQESEAA